MPAKPYRVMEHPYKGEPFMLSEHSSLPAAVRRAAKARLQFKHLNPSGYGIQWVVERTRDGATYDEYEGEWISRAV